jgi:hypothetical protein
MTMRISNRVSLLVLLLFLTVGSAYPTSRVVQQQVSVSRSLTGNVLVRGTDEPAGGATVEVCSPDWQTVLASTKTDEQGHFSLEQPAAGKLFYIRVSAPGMDIYELRVRINKRAKQDLTIHLSIAT